MTTKLSNAPLSGRPRFISLSRTGRWLLVSRSGAVDLHDILGTMPARRLPAFDGPAEFVGGEIWALDGDALARILPRDLKSLPSHASVPGPVTSILAGFGEACSYALIAGAGACRVTVQTGEPVAHPVEELADGEQVVALHGSRLYVAGRRTLRAIDRRPLWKIGQLDGDPVAASVLFGGRNLALLLRGAQADVVLVLSNDRRVHQIAVPRTRCWALVRRGRLAVRQAHRRADVERSLRQPRGQLPPAATRHVRGRGDLDLEPRRRDRSGVQAAAVAAAAVPVSRRGDARALVGRSRHVQDADGG